MIRLDRVIIFCSTARKEGRSTCALMAEVWHKRSAQDKTILSIVELGQFVFKACVKWSLLQNSQSLCNLNWIQMEPRSRINEYTYFSTHIKAVWHCNIEAIYGMFSKATYWIDIRIDIGCCVEVAKVYVYIWITTDRKLYYFLFLALYLLWVSNLLIFWQTRFSWQKNNKLLLHLSSMAVSS